MDATQRIVAIRKVADHLKGLSQAEADLLLDEAHAGGQTSSNWSRARPSSRREHMLRQLSDEESDVLSTLLQFTGGDVPPPRDPAPRAATARESSIFVVHGHARAILHETVRMLERATGREVIVLHEQPNAGRTVIEKFEDHAAGAAYAVVLLTADDTGGAVAASERLPRGRQNVVFELGFFFGKLGRDRVTVLLDPSVEKPSDVDGLVYISLDEAGAWKQALARELTSADVAVDYARIP